MRARDACWAWKATTAVLLPARRVGDSVRSGNGAGIFIRTALRLDRPMVTKGACPAVCSADCPRVMTVVPPAYVAGLRAVVTIAVLHLELDLKGGSGVFVMADNKCVFS